MPALDRGLHPTRHKQLGRHNNYPVLEDYLKHGDGSSGTHASGGPAESGRSAAGRVVDESQTAAGGNGAARSASVAAPAMRQWASAGRSRIRQTKIPRCACI